MAGKRSHSPWITVLGFASLQSFFYSFIYMGTTETVLMGSLTVERFALLLTLLNMIAGFVLVALLRPKWRNLALSTRFSVVYGLIIALAAFLPSTIGNSAIASAVRSVLCGIPIALMLCAWGRRFGMENVTHAMPQVFLGSAFGAAFCLLAATLGQETALALYFLPLVSMVLLHISLPDDEPENVLTLDKGRPDDFARLNGSCLGGTLLFGIANGLMETFDITTHGSSHVATALAMFIFAVWCICCVEVSRRMRRRRQKRAAVVAERANRATLDGSYRSAILIMMTGFLLIPLISSFNLPSKSVVLAGYLALMVVLMSLFLIMGHLREQETAQAFGVGLGVLMTGELTGVLIGSVTTSLSNFDADLVIVIVAGVGALFSYLFLFTDRDLAALSMAVEETDYLQEVLRLMTTDYKLSKRESEVLSLAVRGRTSERIASEFFISKNTVDTHLRRIYGKCNVHSRQELIDLCERIQAELHETSSIR